MILLCHFALGCDLEILQNCPAEEVWNKLSNELVYITLKHQTLPREFRGVTVKNGKGRWGVKPWGAGGDPALGGASGSPAFVQFMLSRRGHECFWRFFWGKHSICVYYIMIANAFYPQPWSICFKLRALFHWTSEIYSSHWRELGQWLLICLISQNVGSFDC